MNRFVAISALCECLFLLPPVEGAVSVRQLHRLTPIDTTSNFGRAVATDGHTILVGAPYGGSYGSPAYLIDAVTGQHFAQLAKPADAHPSFGESVAIDGTKAVVGSWGRAYVYDFADLQNITRMELIADGPATSQFGISVDISGDAIIVGDNSDAHAGNFSGAAFLFDAVSGQQFAKLIADDTAANDNFGIEVAISGTRALVGANNAGGGTGAAYLFDASRDANGDRLISLYTAEPPTLSYSFFGTSLDIAGDQIVVAEANGSAYQWTIGEPPTRIPTSDGFHDSGDFTATTERFSLVSNPFSRLTGPYSTLFDNATKDFVLQIPFGFPEVAMAGNLIVIGANVYQIIPEPSTLLLSAIAVCVAIPCRRR